MVVVAFLMSIRVPRFLIHCEAVDFHKRSDELIFVGDLIGKGTGMGSGKNIVDFSGVWWV